MIARKDKADIFGSYFIILVALALGIGVLAISEKIPLPAWIAPPVMVFVLFVLLNVTFSWVLHLNSAIREYWNVKKTAYLPIAFIAGCIIAGLPAVLSIITGKAATGDINFEFNFSFTGLFLTFIIVSWEELWFRGIFLNYSNMYLSEIHLSITMGLLFMLIHVVNPQIDLLKKGPALFFAGALLTILYFYFKSIWIPIGVHFGNNYTGTFLKNKIDDDAFWGGDGYLTAIILCLCFSFFFMKIRDAHTHE